MTRMIFGALVASIAIGLVGVAIAGSPAQLAGKRQKPAKLNVARVHASLSVPPGQVSPIVRLPCPKGHKVVSGSISPGATDVAVDGPTPGRESWSGAVGNSASFTAHWTMDVVCVRAGNRYQRVARGRDFRAVKRQYDDYRRLLEERRR